jgi:hypothetical protein
MIVVSGEPRSGTSMMMQMIQALGLKLIGEQYIHEWNKDLNPGGIYEVEGMYGTGLTKEVLNGEVSFLSDEPLVGDVIKLPTMDLLKSDPSLITKVVYCLRDPREVVVSQRSLKNARGDKTNWENYLQHMVKFTEKLEPDDLQNIVFIDYGDIMWSPRAEVKRLAKFLEVEPNDEARAIPNPKHYRSKKHKAKVNSVGRAAIRMYEALRGHIV